MHGCRIAGASLIVAAIALGGAAPAWAEAERDGLTLSGSLRTRYDTIAGQPRAGFNASDDLFQTRAIVRVDCEAGDVRLVGELHDSRAWGANAGTPLSTGEVNALEPVQAYVQADLGDVLDGVVGRGSKTTLRAGRMTLALGSTRLIAADDYRNTTNGFTGVRADVAAPGGVSATAIYVLPLMRLPDDAEGLRHNRAELDKESFDAVLWGGFLARQRPGSPLLAEVSLLHFGERDAPGRPTRDRSLTSAGVRVMQAPRARRFDWGVEAIYQWGRLSTSLAAAPPRVAASATYLRGQAGYSFAGPWKPRLQVEFDRASGAGTAGTYGRFDPLFGARRGDLAPTGLYGAVSRANLLSPGVRLELAPSPRLDAMVAWRGLWLADRRDSFAGTGVRDASGQSGNFAGHQVDARLRYWLMPQRLRMELTGVVLAKGRFLKAAPDAPESGPVARYGSASLTVRF